MKMLNLEDFITAQISEREKATHEHERKGEHERKRKRKRKKLDKRNFKNILTPPKRTSYKST